MKEWLEQYGWTLGYVACFFAGMAVVLGARVYEDFKEARLRAQEQRLLERGPYYDEDDDVARITSGWDLPQPVSPGSVTIISPSPLLKEPSGGYATVGTVFPRPTVDQRYATLTWLDTNREPRPTIRGRARVLATGEGKHRTENVFTTEIDLKAIMERLEMENEWQRESFTEPFALPASDYAMAQ